MSLWCCPCRLSETTPKTVNGDFHKVKLDVFMRKEDVSGHAEAPHSGTDCGKERGCCSVAEIGAQSGQLGAELGHFPLEAGEAVLGGGQLFCRFFATRLD